MMWPNCSFGGGRCAERESANPNAWLESAVTACNYYPLSSERGTIHFTNAFVAAARADSSVKVGTLPDIPASFLTLQQPQPPRRQLCRQQCCADQAAAAAALRRSLNAQRQRIRRLDESYRAAERVRNAQRQRRLRADAEYRERELLRSRLRRQQKGGFKRRLRSRQTWQGEDVVLEARLTACRVPGSMSLQAPTGPQTSPQAPSRSPRLANVAMASSPGRPRVSRAFPDLRLENAERASDLCFTGVDNRCHFKLHQRRAPPLNALSRQRAQYCSFEELNWLRDSFSSEEWTSLQSLWSRPTQGVRWQRDANGACASTATWAPAIAAGANPVPLTAPRLSFMAPTAIHHMRAARYPRLIVGPEAPGDGPKTRLLLSVPTIALDVASTLTLEDLLTGAIPMRFRPDGSLVPLKSNGELAP